MSGIAHDSIAQFQQRVARFAPKYIADWAHWLEVKDVDRPQVLGKILRRWQACRPNRMRRAQLEASHKSPYLEDLLELSHPHLQQLLNFDMSDPNAFSPSVDEALRSLWDIFSDLSYSGKVRDGLTGVVGISKAVMLLSHGRVGPAFDSQVRLRLGVGSIDTAGQWLAALREASRDIRAFETANITTLANCVLHYAHLPTGRIYDMALGPSRGKQ